MNAHLDNYYFLVVTVSQFEAVLYLIMDMPSLCPRNNVLYSLVQLYVKVLEY